MKWEQEEREGTEKAENEGKQKGGMNGREGMDMRRKEEAAKGTGTHADIHTHTYIQ